MGGRLFSGFSLAMERVLQIRLQMKISILENSISSYAAEIQRLIEQSATGARETFEKGMTNASEWETRARTFLSSGLTESLPELKRRLTAAEQLAREGSGQLHSLLTSFKREGGRKAREVARQLVDTRAQMAHSVEVCRHWMPDFVAEWDQAISDADQAYEDEDYWQAEELLNQLTTTMQKAVNRCSELAEKQLARLELLRSLRQVCCEMGMEEVTPPHYEDDQNAASRILLTVASVDRGEIAFALTLDGISSEAAPGQCLRDIEKLQQLLLGEHAIETCFRHADDEQPRDTRRKRKVDHGHQEGCR